KIPSIFQAHDIFLFPSYREPSGNVVMEALSYGVPPIVADYGGPGYLVTKECGWKIPVCSRDSFCTTIARVIDSIQLGEQDLQSMAIRALSRANLLGNWQKKVEWILERYDEVLRKKGMGLETILR
ncbi:MAG TPA: glycosyltransferase, partial [Planctomycetes bacterium]|nr:glycosyltransferase [Planctomycetota bacterium]